MKITIKLFALLGAYLPPGASKNQAEMTVGEDATIAEVIAALNLPLEHCHLVLVNGTYVAPGARAETHLKEGDALAIWPPVAGG